ncbi:tetratricopeptide repeat protein [Methylomonas sp. EFPC3]|uniref:tetratricopeptide repeat protein n=1 Tax=Methylomonas sp. EFPC3 TaxID=3021710 RepID=UPI0024174378|nr:tetratricopeptide repeat protein [Methylomonas sp. EFPC3]WFP48606.1 tetratricopeptide repeat protein [Methylomonas sp. EFPC3]
MSAEKLQQLLQLAIAQHQAGRLAEAQALYLQILQLQPEHAQTHHNMGVLALQVGQFDIALNHLERAMATDPAQHKYQLSYLQALVQGERYPQAREVLQQAKQRYGLVGPDIAAMEQVLAAPAGPDLQALYAHFQQGRYAEGEQLARRLLALFPESGIVWKILGLFLLQQQIFPEALQALGRAADLLPDDAEALLNYASALHGQGCFAEAIDAYRRSLQLEPNNVPAYANLGSLLYNLGRYAEAETCFARLTALTPDTIDAWLRLGLSQQAQSQFAAAEQVFRTALAKAPFQAEVHYQLAVLLKSQARAAEALAACRQALALNPDYAEAFCTLGSLYYEAGDLVQAEAHFRNALAKQADYPEALNNLGTTLQMQRRLIEAESSYRRALELNPAYVDAVTNLGINLQSQGRIAEAEACWRRSLALNPDQIATQSGLLFHLNYSAHTPNCNYLEEAQKFAEMAEHAARPFADWLCDDNPERLRIGLVSGDLRDHPVGHFLLALLRDSDPQRVEFIAYATQPETDHYSMHLQPYLREWKNIGGFTDATAAELIRGDAVHILIDLAGHSAHNRLPLFAWKPAPVQISWLGYLASTGLPAIDYVLSDPYSILAEDEQHFTEAIWRLPQTCLCFTPPQQAVEVRPLPALQNGYITFGSFNNLTKISDDTVELWAQVLQHVPDAKLFLKASQLNEALVRERTIARFAGHGIDRDRLVLSPPFSDRTQHLAAYQSVDIALDTFPYPGVTTSVEALWMGVPVLTLRGGGLLARAAESIATNAGLADWIAADQSDYLQKAAGFAADLGLLSQLRSELRDRLEYSPLFAGRQFAEQFAQAMREMWTTRVNR